MSYVTAPSNILNFYGDFCKSHGLSFSKNPSVISPDDTTLFCTSGMQHFKNRFSDTQYQDTFSNIQTCLRLNDLDEIGDGTHHLVFHMLGLFSFRQWSVSKTIGFWLELLHEFGVYPDTVTIHPDKMDEWKKFYQNFGGEIKPDLGCIWSDGNIGGYCTEFYRNGVEIGNIVNPLGTCIDVGFGGERLNTLKFGETPVTKQEILLKTCETLIGSGIESGHYQHGYVLKKLLIKLLYTGGQLNHPMFEKVYHDQKKKYFEYLRLSQKNSLKDQSKDWWKDTHGIEVDNLSMYQKIFNQ